MDCVGSFISWIGTQGLKASGAFKPIRSLSARNDFLAHMTISNYDEHMSIYISGDKGSDSIRGY